MMDKGYTPPTRFREWLTRVFRAHVMLYEYDQEWDHFLRMAVILGMVRPYYHSEEPNPEWFSDSTLLVGDKKVWVGNYPSSYGVWQGSRPSYATMQLLRKEHRRLVKENREWRYQCLTLENH